MSWPALAGTSVHNRRVQPNQTVAQALRATGLDDAAVEAVVQALEGVFDCRRSRSGDQLRLVVTDGALDVLDYRQSAVGEFQVRRVDDRYVGARREIEVERQLARVELEIEGSVYETLLRKGESPELALSLADVFAWDIDFYRDVQRGDRARLLVEKYVSKGRTLRYGDVLAAWYDGSTVGTKKVFRYVFPSGDRGYFAEDGSSARKTFLKSPLKYAHVTSRFGSRLHPVLKYLSAHNGVDYGTPVGTPVWAVADGAVTRVGYDRGGGNMVCLRHLNSLETCYLHLSRFGDGLTVGRRVTQKQVIGYSGNTGLSTGPHLHFAMKRGGQFVNPLNQNFPRAEPVPAELRAHFAEQVSPLSAGLAITSVAAIVGQN